MTKAVLAVCSLSPEARRFENGVNRSPLALASLLNQGVAVSSTGTDRKPDPVWPPVRPPASAGGLTEEDIAVCRSMGISQQDFLASKGGAPSAALSAARPAAFAGSQPATGGLTPEEVAICRSMGISQQDFVASKGGAPSAALSAARPAAFAGAHGAATGGLTEFEVAICASLGVSHAAFLAAKLH